MFRLSPKELLNHAYLCGVSVPMYKKVIIMICVYVRACVWCVHACVCGWECMYAYINVHVCMCMCAWVYMCACIIDMYEVCICMFILGGDYGY